MYEQLSESEYLHDKGVRDGLLAIQSMLQIYKKLNTTDAEKLKMVEQLLETNLTERYSEEVLNGIDTSVDLSKSLVNPYIGPQIEEY